MTGTRIRRLLALIVLGAIVMRVVRVLRGHPTRAFDRTVHRRSAPAPTAADQRSRPEAVPTATPPDELPFAPAVADVPTAAIEPEPVPVPAGAAKADPVTPTAAGPTEPTASSDWVAPIDGSCPEGYPVKAKVRSGIFHLPGMSAYDRTTPDRCYRDADAATADGLRVAKR